MSLGYKWVTKNFCLAVNLALFDTFLPNTFSKQSAKKTSGARHAFGSNPSGLLNLLNRSRVGLRGPRAMFLENGL